jgi:hypothetical protein
VKAWARAKEKERCGMVVEMGLGDGEWRDTAENDGHEEEDVEE